MAELELMDALEQVVAAAVAGREVTTPGGELDALAVLARDLRGLPRPDFKARLQADLERMANMATATITTPIATVSTSKHVRPGFNSVVQYLTHRDAAGLVDFIKQAFGAVETGRMGTPQTGMHFEARLGDSMLMLGGGEKAEHRPGALLFRVTDVDAVYARALAAGATSLSAPTDKPYGDRDCSLLDPFGNQWYPTNARGAHNPPDQPDLVSCFLVRGSVAFAEFLEKAFAAETHQRHDEHGVIRHAVFRIGDSIVSASEAHGIYQPLASMLYVHVLDADAAQARAVAAGATALEPPANQPYGVRTAPVRDAWGHTWYLAGPLL